MPTDRTSPDSGSQAQGVLRELQTLLHSLLGLYSQISSRVLTNRMEARQESTESHEGLPIEDLLVERIDRSAAKARPPDREAAPDRPTSSSAVSGRRPTASKTNAGQGRSGPGLFGALSSYFGRHRSSTHSEPFMREKMRKNTLEHINKAFVLAKQGDAKGAKVHAGLAESAMQTAGEYMNDEEYRQFKEEVEKRLQASRQPR